MKFLMASAALATGLATVPAMAQDNAGQIQIRLLGTAVLPDGEIDSVNVDIVGLPADTQTEASDNFVPTVSIEYFLTDAVSIETICCLTQHDVDAVSGLPGAELVSNGQLVPATFTAKYRFGTGSIEPYMGAGITYFLWLDADPGAATIPLGVTNTTLSDEFGFVLQAGADLSVGDNVFVAFDAKRYFVGTTARWFAGDTLAIETEHNLDPWVLSIGVGFRF